MHIHFMFCIRTLLLSVTCLAVLGRCKCSTFGSSLATEHGPSLQYVVRQANSRMSRKQLSGRLGTGLRLLQNPTAPISLNDYQQPSSDYLYNSSYVALCVAAKDQAQDLLEFIQYHAWLGVGKIYVLDNNSNPPLRPTLLPFIQSGLVEYAEHITPHPDKSDKTVPHFPLTPQGLAYTRCLQHARGRHRWMGFIDIDEFIVIYKTGSAQPSIAATLHYYESYAALALNWRIFGSSNHSTRPAGGVLANYHACLPKHHFINTHIKSIVNVPYTLTVGWTPHYFMYTPGRLAVTPLMQPLAPEASHSSPANLDDIVLHHYVIKSVEEYKQKVARGSGDGGHRDMAYFHRVQNAVNDTCTQALDLGRRCCNLTALAPAA